MRVSGKLEARTVFVRLEMFEDTLGNNEEQRASTHIYMMKAW